jgi:uncharacterized protein (TIGR00369 family)
MAKSPVLADPRDFLDVLPFVREFGIRILSASAGEVTVEMPYAERYSTPPGVFPASMVGTVGDVAAVASCLSKVPQGWAVATLDYTVKMTGQAKGACLQAEGHVLQAGRSILVGAADIYAVTGQDRILCGTLLATARSFELG